MIQLIIGEKGSGKTQMMIDMINSSAQVTSGRVVCIQKSMSMTYSINHSVRVINLDNYDIVGYEQLYGFVCGVLAGDYDITEVYMDGTLKVGGKDTKGLYALLQKLEKHTESIKLIMTVSETPGRLPAEILEYPTITHK